MELNNLELNTIVDNSTKIGDYTSVGKIDYSQITSGKLDVDNSWTVEKDFNFGGYSLIDDSINTSISINILSEEKVKEILSLFLKRMDMENVIDLDKESSEIYKLITE